MTSMIFEEQPPCGTITEVVTRLAVIVDRSRRDGDRVGLFASLYRQVTVAIARAIDDGEFQDAERMSRFDAHFGNRYLEALHAWRHGHDSCPQSWRIAFEFARSPSSAIVQHLILGINAHINLDLAVAAARTAPGAAIHELKHDYDLVNTILVRVVNQIQDALDEVSPGMEFFDRRGGWLDEKLMGWTITRARGSAWVGATALADLPDDAWDEPIRRLDDVTTALARLICDPPDFLHVIDDMRELETLDVAATIAVLDGALDRIPADG